MAYTHRVRRTIANKVPMKVGQLVDASEWRNTDRLVRLGYLEAINNVTKDEIAAQAKLDAEVAAAAAEEPVEVAEQPPEAEVEVEVEVETPAEVIPEPEGFIPDELDGKSSEAEVTIPSELDQASATPEAEAPAKVPETAAGKGKKAKKSGK